MDEVDVLVQTRSLRVRQWPRRPIPPTGVDIHGYRGEGISPRDLCFVVVCFRPGLEESGFGGEVCFVSPVL